MAKQTEDPSEQREIERRRSVFTEWLEKMQHESWQMELLISGFAIFGCLALNKVLEARMIHLTANALGGPTNMGFTMLLVALGSGIQLFVFSLIVHVVTRALWIGAIGLRYVSGDINFEKLRFSDRFKAYFRSRTGSFDDYIERIEKFSSIIFSYAFLLFFIFFSYFVFIIGGLLLAYLSSGIFDMVAGVPDADLITKNSLHLAGPRTIPLVIYVLLGLVVGLDFIFLGPLKRIKKKWFSTIYLPVYRAYSLMSLSFLWRPLLLNFLDEKYTRRLFRLSIPLVVLMQIIGPMSYQVYEFHPNGTGLNMLMHMSPVAKHSFITANYDDLITEETLSELRKMPSFSIPSKRIRGTVFELFVKHEERDEELLLNTKNSRKLKTEGWSYMGVAGDPNEEADTPSIEAHDHKVDSINNLLRPYDNAPKDDPEALRLQKVKDNLNEAHNALVDNRIENDLNFVTNTLMDDMAIFIDDQPVPIDPEAKC